MFTLHTLKYILNMELIQNTDKKKIIITLKNKDCISNL